LLRKMAEKVRGLFGNRANDPDFDVEMQEHMRLLAERYMRKGMAPEKGTTTVIVKRQRDWVGSCRPLSILGNSVWTHLELSAARLLRQGGNTVAGQSTKRKLRGIR
jgi:hypothetical protein